MIRLKIFAAAAIILLLLGSCGTKKVLDKTVAPEKNVQGQDIQMLRKVYGNVVSEAFVTAKMKVNVGMGAKSVSLTGSLKMKRDDVIRIQLVAFGLVEVGQLEITKDYILVVDRMHKRYMKANYNQLSFLKSSGLSFYSLQSLFWNELFLPGHDRVTEGLLGSFSTAGQGNDFIISYKQGNMTYKWTAGQMDCLIKDSYVEYGAQSGEKSRLFWKYSDFKPFGGRKYPASNSVTLTIPGKKELKLDISLRSISNDKDWESRVKVSGKYKEVKTDEILPLLMSF